MNENFRLMLHLALGVLVVAACAACNDPGGFHVATNSSRAQAGSGTGDDGGPPPPALALPEDCPASPEWFVSCTGTCVDPISQGTYVQTPSLEDLGRMFRPIPHPNTECPFYRGGLQNFLIATQPDANGDPAIASYTTIDDLFQKTTPLAAGALAPPGTHRGTPTRAWLGAIKQAGLRKILFDQNGRTLYYGIHVNQAFVDFATQYGLTSLAGVKGADPKLSFPAGIVEFKTAWMDIDPKHGTTNTAEFEKNYVTTKAWVPHLTQDPKTGVILEHPDTPDQIEVALIAIHSVYTLPGHPEFVWASLQHVNRDGGDGLPHQGAEIGVTPNGAPAYQIRPSDGDPNNQGVTTPVSTAGNWLLYKNGVAPKNGNTPLNDVDVILDETAQQFHLKADNSLAQTPIYREFPGSKSNDDHPDDAVASLNANFGAMVAQLEKLGTVPPTDRRGNYRLIGGQWLDKPMFFKLNALLQNDDPDSNPMFTILTALDEAKVMAQFPDVKQDNANEENDVTGDLQRVEVLASGTTPAQSLHDRGSDSPFSITAGEDRMSSTSMESFTQSGSKGGFRNCFACHNTQAITTNGVPASIDTSGGKTLLDAKLLNVSHIFSEFVRDECVANPTDPLCQ